MSHRRQAGDLPQLHRRAAGWAASASCMRRPGGVWPSASGRPARQVVQTCRIGVMGRASGSGPRVPIAWGPEPQVGPPATPAGQSAATGAPRPASRSRPWRKVAASDGRSPGSRIERGRACLPGGGPVACGGSLSAYSCGGSRGVAPRSLLTLHHSAAAPQWKDHRPRCMTRRVTGQTKAHSPSCWAAHGRARAAHAEALVAGASRRPGATSRPRRRGMARCKRASPSTRPGARPDGSTLEAPLDLARRVGDGAPVLVDCLTLWVTNLLLAEQRTGLARAAGGAGRHGARPRCIVSNEVGLGIVPDNALARTVPRPGRPAAPACWRRAPTGWSSWWQGCRWW